MWDFVVVSEIGGRDAMEDTYYFSDIHDGQEVFGGVYDGHGGSFAAEYAKSHLHEIFFRELEKRRREEEAFTIAYEEISQALKDQNSGTTAANFYIKNATLFHANAGDARLIIIYRSKVTQLSKDHRVGEPEERERILSCGGKIMEPYVVKGVSGLMPTRALGDEYFRNVGIIPTPTVGRYQLRPQDQWMVAATDGLFDVLNNTEVAHVLSKCKSANQAAQSLKEEVFGKRGGSDNMTCLVLKRI